MNQEKDSVTRLSFETSVKERVSPSKNKNNNEYKEAAVSFSLEEKEEKSKAKIQNMCMLSEDTINSIKEIFYEVDKYEDLVVKRQILVQRLREDIRMKRFLKEPAVHIIELDRHLSLEKILNQIEEEETKAKGDQKRSKEYISLTQFLKYLTNYETPPIHLLGNIELNQRGDVPKQKIDDQEDDCVDLCKESLKFFEDIFKEMNQIQGFVETIYFVDTIRGDERYKTFKKDLARRSSGSLDLGCETVEEVINRLEMEADKYINWEDFISFFTIRGRPK